MPVFAIAAEAEVYPSDIIGRMKDNNLLVVEGTLYPMLTRLKNDGLLEYTWREKHYGAPAQVFQNHRSRPTISRWPHHELGSNWWMPWPNASKKPKWRNRPHPLPTAAHPHQTRPRIGTRSQQPFQVKNETPEQNNHQFNSKTL